MFLALLALVVAYLFGGAQAGFRAPSAPFVNGPAATFIAYALVQTVVGVLEDADVSIEGVIFNGLLASSIGTVGSWFGARRAARTLAVGGGEPAG